MATINYLDKRGLQEVLDKIAPVTGSVFLDASSAISGDDDGAQIFTITAPQRWSVATFTFDVRSIIGDNSSMGIIFKSSYSDTGYTQNVSSRINSDIWVDTSCTIVVFKLPVSGSDCKYMYFTTTDSSPSCKIITKTGTDLSKITMCACGTGSSTVHGEIYYSVA